MNRQPKIVDTVKTFGRAEQYISFDADFVRWFKRAFNVKEIKNINPEQIVKWYNLRGLVFGNYVTQEERYFYLYKIQKQLEIISSLAGHNNLGKGKLIVSFGGHGSGKANAHFNPKESLINLTRGRKGDYSEMFKGENSFLHEYGHFLDFEQGRKDQSIPFNFASEGKNGKGNTALFSKPMEVIKADPDYMKNLDSTYLNETIEIFARYFEAAVTHRIHTTIPNGKLFFERTYKEPVYYPKDKLEKNRLILNAVKILMIK